MPFDPTGWAGYKVVSVANSGAAVTAYQQRLQLTSVDVDFALWQADGDDVRITDDALNLLSHWTLTWDSTKQIAEVWVKCDLAAASTTTLRLYYGNAGASSASDYDATMQKLDTDGGAALALYHFDEGTGTPADATGNTTATLVGTGAWVGSDIGGWGPKSARNFATGNALDLSGSNKAVKIASLLDTYGSAYSIEFVLCWPSSLGASGSRLVMKYNTSGGTYNGFDFWVGGAGGQPAGALVYRTVSAGTIHDLLALSGLTGKGMEFTPGKKYRIVIQQSSTHGKEIWINGALEGKDASGTTLPGGGSTGPVVIGGYSESSGGATSNYGVIYVDEFRALNRWQTRDEIVCNWTRRKYFSGISTQQGRLTRSTGNPLLAGSGGTNWDADMAQEPVIYTDGTTWSMYYSGLKNSVGKSFMGLAEASSAEGTYTRNGSAPKMGDGNGGVTNNVAHPGIYYESGVWTIFYSDDITLTANLRRATSSDRTTWATQAIAIAQNAHSPVTGYANPHIFKVGSTYHMLCEGWDSATSRWVNQHFTNTAVDNDGGWTRSAAGILTTLEYFEGHSFSHVSPVKIGNLWHAWYHTNTTGSSIPSVIVHAVSADLDYWLPDYASGPVLDQNADGTTISGNTVDQIADPSMIESGGTSYLFYDRTSNYSGVWADIRVAKYAGTVAQFVVDNPSISSVADPPVAIAATLISSTANVRSPVVVRSAAYAVAPSMVASSATFGAATVARSGVAAVAPSRIASTVSFGTATAARSAVATATPARIASTASVPAPVVARASVAAVTASRIASTAAIGSHVVAAAGQAYVLPTRIGSTVNVPSPTVTRAGVEQIVVGRIASTAAVRPPVVVRTGDAVALAEYRRFASLFATSRPLASPFTQTQSLRSAIDLEST